MYAGGFKQVLYEGENSHFRPNLSEDLQQCRKDGKKEKGEHGRKGGGRMGRGRNQGRSDSARIGGKEGNRGGGKRKGQGG